MRQVAHQIGWNSSCPRPRPSWAATGRYAPWFACLSYPHDLQYFPRGLWPNVSFGNQWQWAKDHGAA
jgi:hypothetical protein